MCFCFIILCGVHLGLGVSVISAFIYSGTSQAQRPCLLFICLYLGLGVVYLGSSSRHGLWLIVSCGGGGVGMDGEVRGFFISSPLCGGIWMTASSKCHSWLVLIIINGFHLLHRSHLQQQIIDKELDLHCMLTLHLIQCVQY